MSVYTVEIPDSVRREVEELSARDGVSPEQFLATAAVEKISALRTVEFLREEAAAGSREDWDYVMSCVPARPPMEGDEMVDSEEGKS
jgi:hypothetical protein